MKKVITITAALLMATMSLKAQIGEIIYRDFEPDSILIFWLKLGPVWIDLDSDGDADDLKMKMSISGSICYPEIIAANSSIKICHVEPYCVLTEVEEENWTNYVGWHAGCESCGYFNYGFRINHEGEYYYGWFETYSRVIQAKNGKRIVHYGLDRAAYCTIPNYPLRWGQTEIETSTPIIPDLYTIGYKDESSTTRTAMLFKNNELLHSISVAGKQITPSKIACDTQGNLYWMVGYSENGATMQTEIWKNGELFVSTEGQSGVSINDIYCLNDTLFYVGNTTNENGRRVATVWRGPDFTPHWILGDGLHNSFITDADVDASTNIPYYCGYVVESYKKAIVWKAAQQLFKDEPEHYANYTVCNSQAHEISVDNGVIQTIGHYYLYYDRGLREYHPCIWRVSNNGASTWMAQPSERINALCTFVNSSYFCDDYPEEQRYSVCRNYSSIEVTTFPYPFEKETTINNIRRGYNDIYMVGKWNGQAFVWKNFQLLSPRDNCDEIMDIVAVKSSEVDTTLTINGSEWYYEILNDDGSVTYQHLEYASDTTINGKRPKVIVRSNTHYDRDVSTEITHEYIYEENGIVYWWNKDLQEFTTLYDLTANVDNEWEIKVGNESITMHVDAVENFENEGKTYRMLHVSDSAGFFNGNIVSGFGHMTSFFPERLMNRGEKYSVEGLRCYWLDGDLILKIGDRDCDEVYQQLHNGLDETENAAFTVYPNPVKGVLFVKTQNFASLPYKTYRITNLMGQTLLQGTIITENQQIDITTLLPGMYFISVGGQSVKFVVK